MDLKQKLSNHLPLSEMISPNDHGTPTDLHLANMRRFASTIFEPLRAAEGNKPITLTSGWRSVEHNREVDGAPKSEHLDGIAGDFQTGGIEAQIRRAALASKIPGVGGIGIYPGKTIIHLDARARVKGKITTWQQQPDGTYISPAPADTIRRIRAAGGVNL